MDEKGLFFSLSPCVSSTKDEVECETRAKVATKMAAPNSTVSKKGLTRLEPWEWVHYTNLEEVNEGHAIQVTNLKYPVCQKGFCRVNCKKNPNCLNKLGEAFWYNDIKDTHWTPFADDPEELYRRKEGYHVGLQNLGATCYINTFLQLWFHNEVFRSVIFKWRPPEGYMIPVYHANKLKYSADSPQIPQEPPPIIYPEIYGSSSSTAILSRLQLIFALMKDSKRSFIDPRQLVEALNLQEHEQQDAQEFSNLFMSVLQDGLQSQDPLLWSSIESQFSGQCSYVTRCMQCGTSSRRRSKFSEIVLSLGHSVLHECIREFLKEEKLEGENKYTCLTCKAKRDATRNIHLDTLPPVLSMQLLRFVYDRETWSKRKVNTSLHFPRVLNMNEFMIFENEEDGIYALSAVLLHKGLSANSGHYVARIKDPKIRGRHFLPPGDILIAQIYRYHLRVTIYSIGVEGSQSAGERLQLIQFFTESFSESGSEMSREAIPGNHYLLCFDDKDVVKTKSSSSQGALDDDTVMCPGVSDEEARPKQKKGFDSSKNAYMLVYTKQKGNGDLQKVHSDGTLSLEMQNFLDHDNNIFTSWLELIQIHKKEAISAGKEKQREMIELLDTFSVTNWEETNIIPTEWIKRWLSPQAEAVPAVSVSELLCCHGKLPYTSVTKIKQISSKAAEILYQKYGGDQKLNRTSVCVQCVIDQYHNIKLEQKVFNDREFIQRELKRKDLSIAESFWIGKASLRHWKGWALSESKKSSTNETRRQPEVAEEKNELSDKPMKEEEEEALPGRYLKFNRDLLCRAHGNLSIKQTTRQLISGEAWHRLREYFPMSPEFRGNASACIECQNGLIEREKLQNDRFAVAAEMRKRLDDLFHDKNRPLLPNGTLTNGTDRVYIISNEFLQEWKRFLKTPSRQYRLTIDNSDLLCGHDLLLYSIDDFKSGLCLEFTTLLSENEWNILKSQLEPTTTISVIRDNASDIGIRLEPDVCESCRLERRREESQYDRAVVYVQKMDESETMPVARSLSDGDIADRTMSDMSMFNSSAAYRRSRRRKAKRDEYAVRISSSETLRQLKIKVMKIFATMPSDQHIHLEDGTLLEDHDATLQFLGVRPEMNLYLKIDRPTSENLSSFGVDGLIVKEGKDRKEEEGFKGTFLCPR